MEEDILHIAIKNFFNNSSIKLEANIHSTGNKCIDGELKFFKGNIIYDFPFVVKRRLDTSKIPYIDKILNCSHKIVFVSEYISKELKFFFREKKISYIDAAGNAFLDDDRDVFVYIETNKNQKVFDDSANKAFSKTGLKVIYQFLINEHIINRTYRQIGDVTKVSIDTIGKVIKELLKDKYIIQVDKHTYKFHNKERLLSEWVTVFNKSLRPKLKKNEFKLKNNQLQSLINFAPKNSLGGELAAQILTNHLMGEHAILYVSNSFVDTAKKLNLIPSKNGSIILIEKFWEEVDNVNHSTVNPLLVYADLINKPTPRNIEASKIIFDKYLQ